MTTKPKLLFLVGEDWAFVTHRLPMARAALQTGFDVAVATRVGTHRAMIEAEGIRVIPIGMDRIGMNPIKDLGSLGELVRVYRAEQPDLVHHVGLKPVLYGTWAAHRANIRKIVNAIAGFGFVYVSDHPKARLLRPAIRCAMRRAINYPNAHLVVQNSEALAFAEQEGIAPVGRTHLIKGSGVDVDSLLATPEPAGPITVTLVARMLWSKGIGDLAAAARLLKGQGQLMNIRLVGGIDRDNPDGISERQLMDWQTEGLMTWMGPSTDIAQVWAKSHVAVLPSWGEGLPKSLMEAMACGRSVVTTDCSGCKELVRHELEGLLVPRRDPSALADALAKLAGDEGLRRRFGEQARRRVEAEFSNQIVAKRITEVYRSLMDGKR